jgi:hypothetical protein
MDDIRERQKPDVTIHLGDIYYSGRIDEVQQFFLGEDDWFRAGLTFALNGNHEMYSGGEGYFEYVLPALHQQASFFCLENEYWRLVAVDTGYYSRLIPFLELLLGTKLHDDNLRWLKEVIFCDPADRRPVILLSHHQFFSSFDRSYERVGKQLAPHLGIVALWFWGHEHRFSGYAPYSPTGGPRVRARCIGHGGMPVEFEKLKHRDVPLVFVDNREAGSIDGKPVGYCGNALLQFSGPGCVVRYFDEAGKELLAEQWLSPGKTGGAIGTVLAADPALDWHRDKEELVA